jgi:hypothetical protein
MALFMTRRSIGFYLTDPIASAEQKRIAAHGLFPSRLRFIQDKKSASRADRGPASINQPLPL